MTGEPAIPPSPHQERLQYLVDRHFDQALTGAERAELEQLLLSSAAARDAFWNAARWHSSIRQWGESEWGRAAAPSPVAAPSIPPAPDPRSWLPRLAAAIAAVLLVAAVWWAYPPSAGPAIPAELATAPASQATLLPVLTRCTEARWQSPGPGRYPGERLPVGTHELRAGLAQIEFPNGAHVVLEAPCTIQIPSPNTLQLVSGRLRAYVPETARGFSLLQGAGGTRLGFGDVATELGFQVDPAGGTHLHVVQGSVHLTHPPHPDSSRDSRIGAGDAVRISISDGRVTPVTCQPDLFPSVTMLARKELEATERQFAAWRAAAVDRARLSELVVFLDFEQATRSARLIQNRAHDALPGEGATLVGCDWVEGRWPGKGAVEFKHESDRLLLNVPSAFSALSVVAWVRVDSLPHRLHSLLMADGPAGRINWCITDSGALSFGIQIPDDGRGWLIHRSSRLIAPEQLGSWLCLATVHQLDGTVHHFINGEPAGSGRLGERTGAKLGRCEIGNAAPPALPSNGPGKKQPNADSIPPAERPRNFVGRMDEFAIYGRGLTAPEINDLHALGRDATPTRTP